MPLFSTETQHFITQTTNIIASPFKHQQIIDNFVELYSKLRRTYRALSLFARIWKIRRTPVREKNDLYMNELDPKHNNTFQLTQPNGIYYFALNHLSRIIVDAITHQSGMFIEPLTAKNPYTNTPLTKTELFNIYFALRLKGTKINEFFQKFYETEFNIYEFRAKCETELRDNGIKQYVRTSSVSELYMDLCDMLIFSRMNKKINPDEGFPKKHFVETMLPYLEMYFLGKYSFSSMTRLYESKKLSTHLKKFAATNPIYGKKVTPTTVREGPIPPTPLQCFVPDPVQYCTKVQHTFGYVSSFYMKTHVYEDDEVFNRYVEGGDSFSTYNRQDDERPMVIMRESSPQSTIGSSQAHYTSEEEVAPIPYYESDDEDQPPPLIAASSSDDDDDEDDDDDDDESDNDANNDADDDDESGNEENDDGSMS